MHQVSKSEPLGQLYSFRGQQLDERQFSKLQSCRHSASSLYQVQKNNEINNQVIQNDKINKSTTPYKNFIETLERTIKIFNLQFIILEKSYNEISLDQIYVGFHKKIKIGINEVIQGMSAFLQNIKKEKNKLNLNPQQAFESIQVKQKTRNLSQYCKNSNSKHNGFSTPNNNYQENVLTQDSSPLWSDLQEKVQTQIIEQHHPTVTHFQPWKVTEIKDQKQTKIETMIQDGIKSAKAQLYDDAIFCFDKALLLDSNSEIALQHKADILIKIEEHDKALMILDQILQQNPNALQALLKKGQVLEVMQQYDRSIAIYKKAIQLYPKKQETYENFAIALFHMKRLEEAISCIDKALSLNPLNIQTLFKKGELLFEGRRYTEAIQICEKILRIDYNFYQAKQLKQLSLYKRSIHEKY